MLQALSGHDPLDPASSTEPVPDFSSQMAQQNRPPRIGLIKDFFFQRSTPEVQDHTERAAQKLADAGAVVEEVQLPESFATAHSCQRIVSNVEAAAFHQKWYRDRADEYGPKIRSSIEMGLLISGVDYLQAQRQRRQLRMDLVEMVGRVDAVLMQIGRASCRERV